jgi:hypothetical protein
MATTKFEVEKFNGKNNFSLWQRRMKDLLIQQGVHNALLGKAKKLEKMENDAWEEMDAKVVNVLHLSLMGREGIINLTKIREFVYGE